LLQGHPFLLVLQRHLLVVHHLSNLVVQVVMASEDVDWDRWLGPKLVVAPFLGYTALDPFLDQVASHHLVEAS